ncbi:MAG: hypothetical protein A2Y65_00690 [Deltaproteobacteria bacterium RBG_13_52_11]|nr:MAG: hypothetical protein A2Y65_00690 [Deltaproteobacteria bacterium RBG_13_52_11]
MAWKKSLHRCCISVIAVLSLVALAWGAAPDKPGITTAKIGKKELVGATGVTIIKEDLTRDREILIRGSAKGGEQRLTKVEVSLDAGKTWNEAQGLEGWQYRFVPVPRKTYELTLRVTNAAGVVSDLKAFGVVKLSYLPITLSELIRQQTDELAKAYMSRDLERYMGLISKDYQQYPRGWLRLRRTISNDFKSRNNIVLRLTVNQVFELEGAIMADIRWRLTYAGLASPKEGYVEIQFDPADQLKILVQEKDRYFGAASP